MTAWVLMMGARVLGEMSNLVIISEELQGERFI